MAEQGRTLFFEWEVYLMSFLQRHLPSFGVALSSIFTMLGEEVVLILIFGLIYWCLDKKAAKLIGTNLLVAIIINPMIKNIVLRRRPYFDHEQINCLRPVNDKAEIYDITFQGYSFPSAHTFNATVMYVSLWRTWRKRIFAIIAFIVPLLVAVSRVALGNHYPTDVLTGWVLGILIAVFMPLLMNRVKDHNLIRLVIFLISSTGIFYCRTDDYFTALGLMGGFFAAAFFEEKFVSFSQTRKPLACILRVAGGCLSYAVINKILKLPFSDDFLNSATMSAHLVRSARYMITVFVMFAVYPMLFDLIKRREQNEQ